LARGNSSKCSSNADPDIASEVIECAVTGDGDDWKSVDCDESLLLMECFCNERERFRGDGSGLVSGLGWGSGTDEGGGGGGIGGR
uniref:C-type lectin domain-containing protein n=1 Tax=Anisakis simplex TaxID=6269 RepID=A0A0M3JPW5_ANISI